MTLFDHLLLRMFRAGHVPRKTTVRVRQYMRAYRHAYLHPETMQMPMPPKAVNTSVRLATLVALFRLSVEQPSIFVLGCLCVVPAAALFAFTLARWSAKGIDLAMLAIGGH